MQHPIYLRSIEAGWLMELLLLAFGIFSADFYLLSLLLRIM